MLGRALFGSGVVAFMGFLSPASPVTDQSPPRLQWALAGEVLALPEGLELRPQAGTRELRVQLQAGDRQGLAELSVTAMGTFRCATRDGSREAPFDVVVSLPTVAASYPITVGQALQTEAELPRPIALDRIYCGRHVLDAEVGPVPLYARSGTVVLRARARDHSGFLTESRLNLRLG